MLAAAKKLRAFDSYKLWVGALSFAGNSLESVDLHRSDGLAWLKIWAPNLRNLGLQGVYGLSRLDFLDCHSMQSQLPPGHVIPHLAGGAL
jgi:hypothetical protein